VLVHAGIVGCCLATASFDDFVWELRSDLSARAKGKGQARLELAKLREIPLLHVPGSERCDEWVEGYVVGGVIEEGDWGLVASVVEEVVLRENCLWHCTQDTSCDAVTYVGGGELEGCCYMLRLSRMDSPLLLMNGEVPYLPAALRTEDTAALSVSFVRCRCHSHSDVPYVPVGPPGSAAPGCGDIPITKSLLLDMKFYPFTASCDPGHSLASCRQMCTLNSCASFEWEPLKGVCQLNSEARRLPSVSNPGEQLFCAKHECTDSLSWRNMDGRSCTAYFREGWCSDGRFVSGFEFGAPGYTAEECSRRGNPNCDALHNYPANNCCECGKAHPGEGGSFDDLPPEGPPDMAQACDVQPYTAGLMLAPQWVPNGTVKDMAPVEQCRARGCCFCPECGLPGQEAMAGFPCVLPPANPIRLPIATATTYSDAKAVCDELDSQLCYADDICRDPSLLANINLNMGIFVPVGNAHNHWLHIGSGGCSKSPQQEWWGELPLDLPHRKHVWCCRRCPLWERPGVQMLEAKLARFRQASQARLILALFAFVYGLLTELKAVPRAKRDAQTGSDTASQDGTSQRNFPTRRNHRPSHITDA